MRKIFLLFFLLSCFFTLSVHPDNVKRMKMLAPIKVRSAVITDSVNTAGERPELAKILMRTHIPVDDSFAATTVINADSTGCFVTERIPGNNLYLFMTDISADRFAKATLKFTSPSYFEVYVDGKRWSARSETGAIIKPETLVRITRMEGVRLFVEKKED